MLSEPEVNATTPPKEKPHPLDAAAAVGFLAYSATATATPICLVVLARELSIGWTAAGALETARSGVIVVILLCSGFIAARFGKARSLGYSGILLGCAMLFYSAAPSYGWVVLAMAVMGVGGGVFEALMNPLVQELHPQESGRYLNFINGFWSLGVLVTVLITGEWLTMGFSWRWIMAGIGIFCLFSGVLFLLLRKKGPPRERVPMGDVLRHKWSLLRSSGFWLFNVMIFCGGAIEGAFTFWSASYIQIHFGQQPRVAAMAVAVFCVGMLIGRFGSGFLFRQDQLRQLITGSAIGGLAIGCALPLSNSIALVFVWLFLSGIFVACFWPSIQSYAVDCLPRNDPTSILILLSCGGIGGFAFASYAMGWWGDFRDIQSSFFIIPIFFVLLLACLWVQKVRH